MCRNPRVEGAALIAGNLQGIAVRRINNLMDREK
jgi:hypothetical protein